MAISRDSFPNDDDGEVLYRLAVDGVDLSCKRELQFYCYVKDRATADAIVEDLASYGYKASVFVSDDEQQVESVSVYASIIMLPKYELVVLEQQRLSLILERYGTACDGWMASSE
jgi:hypothetical protein